MIPICLPEVISRSFQGHFLEKFINEPAHHTLQHLYFTVISKPGLFLSTFVLITWVIVLEVNQNLTWTLCRNLEWKRWKTKVMLIHDFLFSNAFLGSQCSVMSMLSIRSSYDNDAFLFYVCTKTTILQSNRMTKNIGFYFLVTLFLTSSSLQKCSMTLFGCPGVRPEWPLDQS